MDLSSTCVPRAYYPTTITRPELENGSRWRMGGAGEWESLENGSRWRMAGAGEFVFQPLSPASSLPGGTEKGGT